jgi:hypothetical protein
VLFVKEFNNSPATEILYWKSQSMITSISCYTLEPKGEEVAEGWSILQNEELHNLYTSPSIITVIKSRRVR